MNKNMIERKKFEDEVLVDLYKNSEKIATKKPIQDRIVARWSYDFLRLSPTLEEKFWLELDNPRYFFSVSSALAKIEKEKSSEDLLADCLRGLHNFDISKKVGCKRQTEIETWYERYNRMSQADKDKFNRKMLELKQAM